MRQLLYYSCKDLGVKPKTVISASAMGYYSIDAKELMSEDDSYKIGFHRCVLIGKKLLKDFVVG